MNLSLFQHYSSLIRQAIRQFAKVLGGVTSYRLSEDGASFINKDFFKTANINQAVIDELYEHINQTLFSLQAIADIVGYDTQLNNIQKHYIHTVIQGYQDKIQILYHAIVLEASKAGMSIDHELIVQHEQALCDRETQVYGPQVSDIYHEVHAILDHIQDLIYQNRYVQAINATEYERFVGQTQAWSQSYQHQDQPQNQSNYMAHAQDRITLDVMQTAQVFADVIHYLGLNTVIIRYGDIQVMSYDASSRILTASHGSTHQEIKKYLKQQGISKCYAIILDPHKNSIATSLQTLKIPSRYPKIDILRVCELINHEIMTHLVRSYNNHKTLIIKGPMISASEEGLAMINEKLVSHTFDQLPHTIIDIHILATYVGEQMNSIDAERYLTVYFMLTGMTAPKAKKYSKQRVIRMKRFHSLTETYSNRKDVGYTRGYQHILAYLQDNISHIADVVTSLYDAKIDIQDTLLAKDLFVGCTSCQENLLTTLPLGTLIYQCIQGQELRIDDIHSQAQYLITGGKHVTQDTLDFVYAVSKCIMALDHSHTKSRYKKDLSLKSVDSGMHAFKIQL